MLTKKLLTFGKLRLTLLLRQLLESILDFVIASGSYFMKNLKITQYQNLKIQHQVPKTKIIFRWIKIILMLYGPRILGSAMRRIRQPERRQFVTDVLLRAYRRAWRYTMGTIAMALASGLFAFLLARVLVLPAPAALGLLVGVGSVLPFVGVLIGGLPMVLLTVGVDPSSYKVVVVAIVLIAYQVFEGMVLQTAVHRWSVRFGPALTVAVTMVSFELYGVGGAVVGLMLAVLAVAVLDELAPSGDARRAVDAPTTASAG